MAGAQLSTPTALPAEAGTPDPEGVGQQVARVAFMIRSRSHGKTESPRTRRSVQVEIPWQAMVTGDLRIVTRVMVAVTGIVARQRRQGRLRDRRTPHGKTTLGVSGHEDLVMRRGMSWERWNRMDPERERKR